MVARAFVEEVHCPYCAAPLEIERPDAAQGPEILHGIVRCGCYRYPVIDGILVLKQQSGPADTRDERVRHLESGDIDQARYCALNFTSPVAPARTRWQRAVDFAARNRVPLAGALARLDPERARKRILDSSLSFERLLELLRPGLYAQYLFHRYANNSFLASIAPLLLLKELQRPAGERAPRVLELTCGIGHSAFLVRTLFPSLAVVATDHDFVNLYIARRYLAPDVTYVCLDAEAPLPFPDRFFDCVFCLDGFHYLRSKVALVKELDRAVERSGLWLFPHLHNARAQNFNPGIPLSAEDYLRCFAPLPARLFDELRILRDFTHEGMVDLEIRVPHEELQAAQVLTLVGSRREDLWCKHRDLAATLAKACSELTINPIYRAEPRGTTIRLELSWPSSRLERECRSVMQHIPHTCMLDASLLDRVRTGRMTGDDLPAIRKLVQSFVLVHLPPRYAATTW